MPPDDRIIDPIDARDYFPANNYNIYWTTAHRPCIAEKYADELAKFVVSTNDVSAIDKLYREHLAAMDLTVAEAVMCRDFGMLFSLPIGKRGDAVAAMIPYEIEVEGEAA